VESFDAGDAEEVVNDVNELEFLLDCAARRIVRNEDEQIIPVNVGGHDTVS
jgi:hypothetical protein